MVTALGEYRKARRPTIKTILKRVGFLYRKCRKLLAFDLPGSNNSVAVEERAAVSIDGVWRFDVWSVPFGRVVFPVTRPQY